MKKKQFKLSIFHACLWNIYSPPPKLHRRLLSTGKSHHSLTTMFLSEMKLYIYKLCCSVSLKIDIVVHLQYCRKFVTFSLSLYIDRVIEADVTLRWRHDERDGVSNNQPLDCLLNRLFRRRSKKTSKIRVTGLCADNSPVNGEFPAQRASNAENVSIWWRHHELFNLNTMSSLKLVSADMSG